MDFNPFRLTLARQRRGFSKIELARKLGVSQRAISAYENGEYPPSEDVLEKVANLFGYPRSFFSGPVLEVPSKRNVSFRALSSLTAAQRDSALTAGALAMELSQWLEERFELPVPDLPDLRHCQQTPEAGASALRAAWGLGERPIKNMVHLLEAKGVRVFSLTYDCRSVDAYSFWRNSIPFVFLNTIKSSERSRFDAAHELAHLVLHKHGAPQGREAEEQANEFASCFLMPRHDVIAKAPYQVSLEQLLALKANWKVSAAALTHRLYKLNLMTEWHYRSIFIELAKRGYRSSEPGGFAHETSQVLEKVFKALRQEGLSRKKVAQTLSISVAELDSFIFGLVNMAVVSGGLEGGRVDGIRPELKLLPS